MHHPRRAAAVARQPFTYECAGCATTEHSLDTHIPVGWSILRPQILCADCTASAVHRARRSPLRQRGARA